MPLFDQPAEFTVFGRASQSIIFQRQQLLPEERKKILLFLLAQYAIPIASTCKGQGQCQKCVIWFRGKKMLACQHTVESLSTALTGQNDGPHVVLEVDYL